MPKCMRSLGLSLASILLLIQGLLLLVIGGGFAYVMGAAYGNVIGFATFALVLVFWRNLNRKFLALF